MSREIVRRLVAIGFDVALVREVPGPPQEITEIRYVESNVFANIGLQDFIGDFVTAQTRERAQGIELQIVLGKSFVAFSKDNPGLPAATVVPSDE